MNENKKMTVDKFAAEVSNALEKTLRADVSDGIRCTVGEYTKNNGKVLHGITVADEGKDSCIDPVFYVERYYDRYNRGMDMETIVPDLARAYNRALETQTYDKFASRTREKILSKEYILENVLPRVVNAELNRPQIENWVGREFLDLFIKYAVTISKTDKNVSAIVVTKDLAEEVGVTEEELYEAAKKNAHDTYKNDTLFDFMNQFFGIDDSELAETAGSEEGLESSKKVLMLFSNKDVSYGATVITDDQIMEEAAEAYGGDFYVLPSSIHEVLTLPESYVDDDNELKEMVSSINRSHVGAEDVLSDNVYRYDSKNRRLCLA